MEQKEQHENIYLMLGRIEGGINGINERLNKLNGSVGKHDDRLDKVEKRQSFDKGRTVRDHGITASISATLSAIVLAVITYINK